MQESERLIKEIESDEYEIDKLRKQINVLRDKLLNIKTHIRETKVQLNNNLTNLTEEQYLSVGRRLGYIE